jgi:chemotaxis regulatin CheY-phosphate phosphatase CheZ
MSDANGNELVEQSLLATEDGRAFLEAYTDRIRRETAAQFTKLADAVGRGREYTYAPDHSSEGTSKPSEGSDDEIMEVMRAILQKITMTREELQSISESAKDKKFTHFNAVEDELSAITFDTEKATNTIIDATDEIEHHLHENSSDIPEDVLIAIKKGCHEITMACSFQDICSQRVKKVVEVVQLIDAQIANIERRLGTPVGEDVPTGRLAPAEGSRGEEKSCGYLEGPALPNQSVDQSTIDSIFDD